MKPKNSNRFVDRSIFLFFQHRTAIDLSNCKPLLLAVVCCWGVGSMAPIATAASFTYDADTATAGAQDGAGLGWTTTNTNWLLNGAGSDVLWPNLATDTAVFGAASTGTGGTVVAGSVNVGLIQFNPQTTTGYTLSTGTITLGTGITTTSSVNSVISAKISGTAGLAFTGVIDATTGVTLSGANDYTGITTLSTGGRITVSSGTGLGSSVGASASALGTNYTQVNAGTSVNLTVGSTSEAFLINGVGQTGTNPQGAIRFAAGTTLSNFVQLGSTAQVTSNGSGTVTLNGNLDLAGFTLGVGNGALSFVITKPLVVNGLLTGTSTGILDIGAGGGSNVVRLTNNSNTFSGTTRVNASSGTSMVELGGDTVLGTSTLVFNGGGAQSTNSTARTIANTIGTFTGSATFGQTTTQTGTLNFTYNTALVSLGTSTRTFTTNVDTTFAAAFSNSGGLTKAGAATLFLTNTASTRTGTTTINAGILNVTKLADGGTGNNSSIGAGAATAGLLQFGGGTLQYTGSTAQSTNRLFTLNTGGGTIDASGSVVGATLSFTGTGALDGGTGATARSLTLAGTNAGNNSLAGILADGTGSAVSLVKSGNGTWAVSGANTYTGTTTISAGTLLINGTNSGTGAVDVGASGTLGGIGTIAGGVNVTGVLNPGASIESLATGTVAFISGSKLTYELQDTSSAGADLVDITGNLSLAGMVTLDLVKLGAATWNVGDKLTLLSYTGTITANSFFNFADGGDGKLTDDETFSFDGTQWIFDYNDLVAGSNYSSESSGTFVTMTVIPEPNAAILVGGLGALVLFRRRRNS